MNIPDVRKWAEGMLLKDNAQLISEGVIDKQTQNARQFLKGIVQRCDMITANTSKNNQCLNQIEGFLGELAKRGLQIESKKGDGNKK